MAEFFGSRDDAVNGVVRYQHDVVPANLVSAGAGDVSPPDLASSLLDRIRDRSTQMSDAAARVTKVHVGTTATRLPGARMALVGHVVPAHVANGVQRLVRVIVGKDSVPGGTPRQIVNWPRSVQSPARVRSRWEHTHRRVLQSASLGIDLLGSGSDSILRYCVL